MKRKFLVAWLLVACLMCGAPPTVWAKSATADVSSATYTYDVPTIARVDVHQINGGRLQAALLGEVREASALPSVEAQSASTTPHAPVVATERGLFEVRPPNPEFPPSESVVDVMGKTYHPNCDCSEIAQDLMSANGGEGSIIRYEPPKGSPLHVPEQGGKLIENYTYHEVYTDGRYVYDPAFSSTPVPKGDYDRMIRGLNPGVHGG